VLDVGCGAGRVSLHLQERGHEVVAIDESPLAVEVARRRGVRDARAVSLAAIDASFGQFDTVLILRNNFGLAGPPGETTALLDRLAVLTTAGGRIITDSVDPARTGDPLFRADLLPVTHHASPVTTPRYRVRWRQYATPWFRYLMFAPKEFERLVAGSNSGWRVRRVIDDGSPRYLVVLEKA
jgi:SAM-dependent methyltransferase